MKAGLWFPLLLAGCFAGGGAEDDVCAAEFTKDTVEGAPARTIGTLIPDDAGEYTIHVRLTWPDGAPGDGERWPMALLLQGGWAHIISEDARVQVAEGLVEVRVDLPGGGQSGGTDDRRGPAARAAVASVLRWMAGESVDIGGCTAERRTRGGAPDDLYVVGISNGGNLATAALADPALDRPPIHGLVTWETPVSPEFVNVELGGDPTVYVEGSCALTPSLTCALPVETFVEEKRIDEASIVCFDLDGDLACTEGVDVVIAGTEDPLTGNRLLSPELTAAVVAAGYELRGYATPEDAVGWWAWRDASSLAATLVQSQPDLPILIVASETDHVQTTPDHPHVFGWGQALQEAGAAWTRLNPGTDWLAANTAENSPNAPMSLAEPDLNLLSEEAENPLGSVLAAAVTELSEEGGW